MLSGYEILPSTQNVVRYKEELVENAVDFVTFLQNIKMLSWGTTKVNTCGAEVDFKRFTRAKTPEHTHHD